MMSSKSSSRPNGSCGKRAGACRRKSCSASWPGGGLALAWLEPRSDAIQLVAYDGEHLGHVRREGARGPDERWVAVLKAQARQVASFGSAAAAAAALALACGKMTDETS